MYYALKPRKMHFSFSKQRIMQALHEQKRLINNTSERFNR